MSSWKCGTQASKLKPILQWRLDDDYHSGKYTLVELMELYRLERAAICATIERARERRATAIG